jgi:hypothetical protein
MQHAVTQKNSSVPDRGAVPCEQVRVMQQAGCLDGGWDFTQVMRFHSTDLSGPMKIPLINLEFSSDFIKQFKQHCLLCLSLWSIVKISFQDSLSLTCLKEVAV